MEATMIESQADVETVKDRILIADDQPDVLNALRLLLKGQGYETETVASPSELLRAMAERDFDLLLMDLNYARDTTSGHEGLDLLNQLKQKDDAPPIVVMTGWATVGLAVAALTSSKSPGLTRGYWKSWASKSRSEGSVARHAVAPRKTWPTPEPFSNGFCQRASRNCQDTKLPVLGSQLRVWAGTTTTCSRLTRLLWGCVLPTYRAKACRRHC